MRRAFRAGYVNTRTAVEYQKFENTGRLEDLRKMIAHGEEMVGAFSPDDEDVSVARHHLATAYLTLFEQTGDSAALDTAIRYEKSAIASTAISYAGRGSMLTNLGIAYLRRFEFGSLDVDLASAVEWSEQAVAAARELKPTRARSRQLLAMTLSNLTLTYFARFERYGTVADVWTAIDCAKQALEIHPARSPSDLAEILTNLCNGQLRLYLLYGTSSDLQRAIEWGEQAKWTTPSEHPDLGGTLSNLSLAYLWRYDRHGDPADLETSIEHGERAAKAFPAEMPARGGALSNLGSTYLSRFERTGDLSDLDASVDRGRQAIAITASDDRDLGNRLTTVAIACQRRFERNHEHADLRVAVESAERALAATPTESPESARRLGILASAYLVSVRAGFQPPDRSEVVQLVEKFSKALDSPPTHRAYGAYSLGLLLSELDLRQPARKMLREAIQVLPAVALRQLTWGDQEYLLGRFSGLVAECVSAELDDGDIVGAVEHAELGRTVLLSAQLDTRTDLTDLEDVSPSLASRFRELGAELSHLAPAARRSDVASVGPRRRALSAEWDEVVRRIRQVDGFEHFLARPSLTELRQSVNDGTAVLVNAGNLRGDAVLVRAGTTESVRLRALKLSDVNHYAESLAEATGQRTRSTASDRRRLLTEILEWLWVSVTEPVLNALGEGAAHRVWWMPTGRLGLLPLHAAGLPGGPSVMDLVVSSYTPTLRALLHSRRQQPADLRRQLTVALEHTPGQNELPGAVAEASYLSGGAFASRSLVDSVATKDAVLSALRTTTWAHFACHAFNDPATPSQSGLALHDGLLRVSAIGALRLEKAELAYLSACSTAKTGWDHTDEAIHLASVFQLAGYRHVVGVLWPFEDGSAQVAARLFYDQLADKPRADQAPFALHQVCRTLRSEFPDRPDLWAGLVHSGP
ncbi:CHAT domain-containing protein [Amycolatopsis sp. MJM2582]|uniref:CHAT domain-containing protein n=1 Tax=Amycolatopsis sp. MJM2582 TaxID=1427749 RepID=UPI00069025B9|nr:CHAT domain-containing protein [Amycolatopsis sp. MJM2582]